MSSKRLLADWKMNGTVATGMGVFLVSTQVGYLWLSGIEYSALSVISHTNQRRRRQLCRRKERHWLQVKNLFLSWHQRWDVVQQRGSNHGLWNQINQDFGTDFMCGLDGITRSQ